MRTLGDLDAETIPFVDMTAAKMLDELAGDLRRRGGVELLVARDAAIASPVTGDAPPPDPARRSPLPIQGAP